MINLYHLLYRVSTDRLAYKDWVGRGHAEAIFERNVYNAVWVEPSDMNIREYYALNKLKTRVNSSDN